MVETADYLVLAGALGGNSEDRGDEPSVRYLLKRPIDLIGAALLLVFTLPLMALIALSIALGGGGPVLFRQSRIGLYGAPFEILKFRTMRADAQVELNRIIANDADAGAEWDRSHKLARDPRVTPLGRLLRLSSLDELPQLFNVLRGDMSLVGPRPIVTEEVARYGRYFANYCSARPGMTGLWQVSGRNSTTYFRRVALDVAYSRQASLWLDFKIALKTIPDVLTGKGS